jgi:Tfp pilus assembly protein PilN
MAAQKFVALNLLSKDAFSESLVGKSLLWALSIGRYVVVFTELIVIMSFLSRFKLDRDLTDLTSQINQQVTVIDSYGDLEARFRTMQNTLTFIRSKQGETSVMGAMDRVIDALPADVKLRTLTVNKDRISVSAVALSAQGFYQFVTQLKSDRRFTDIKIASVGADEDIKTAVVFDLAIEVGTL